MKYDIRQIYDWPQIPRFMVIGLICFIFFILGYMLAISSLKPKYKAVQQHEEEIKAQFSALAKREQELKDNLSIYSKLESELNKERQNLINSSELPQVLNEILKIGTQNELQFSSFTPGVQEKSGNYLKVVIKAAILGSYDQISSFLSQVANLNKTVSIGDFTIAKASADKATLVGNQLMADIVLEIYEAKPNEKK